jgi:hypothetical protein
MRECPEPAADEGLPVPVIRPERPLYPPLCARAEPLCVEEAHERRDVRRVGLLMTIMTIVHLFGFG